MLCFFSSVGAELMKESHEHVLGFQMNAEFSPFLKLFTPRDQTRALSIFVSFSSIFFSEGTPRMSGCHYISYRFSSVSSV